MIDRCLNTRWNGPGMRVKDNKVVYEGKKSPYANILTPKSIIVGEVEIWCSSRELSVTRIRAFG